MNNIYYFTGTGNSLQIAIDISKQFDESLLTKISDYNGEIVSGESLGIVFPVYNFGLPQIVVEFLKKLNVSETVYIYAVANYGALPGKALDQCKSMLKQKNRDLSSGFLINMPGNNITFYDAYSKKKQQKLFAAEQKRTKFIINNVKGMKKLEIEKSNYLIDRIFYKVLYNKISCFHKADMNYSVSNECSGCGLCEFRCQVKNINIANGKPEWQHHCEKCMACIQSCPNKAIDFKGKTKDRTRYLNPNIEL